MKKNKIMLSVISGLLVAAVAVGGTLAYLSDKTDTVTNTFNVGTGYEEDEKGHVGLWLDETDKTGEENPLMPSETDRTETGVTYDDMYPGDVVAKDPTFHLTDGSIESYVFAEVEGLDALIEQGYFVSASYIPMDPTSDPKNDINRNWVKVSEGDGLDGIYRYTTTVGGDKSDEMEPLFSFVRLGSGVDNEEFDDITLTKVYVRGVAVQADNTNEASAYAAAQEVLTAAGSIEDSASSVGNN